jgi:predicted dehydrogenase
MHLCSRRRFLHRAGILTSGACVGSTLFLRAGEAPRRRWRAAIIGCTGCGDYGHGLDVVFENVPHVDVVALADPDQAGRRRAAERSGAKRTYADFQEMLLTVRPELVVVAPRWSEQHFNMAKAAIDNGAHVLLEKPFTTTLAEADALLNAARQRDRKIAVAHQMRMSPNIVQLRKALENGLIGDLVQMRSWGKQDTRAGGEDMIVLGTHLFDMMRFVAGDPASCYADVFHRGRSITAADARAAGEKIGPVAGDEIEAAFQFGRGVTATFTSRGRLRETLGPWSLELYGTRGAIRVGMDIDPRIWKRERQTTSSAATVDQWLPWPSNPTPGTPAETGFGPANRRVVLDWLHAIERGGDPECSGQNAMKAIEMAMAVYQSALTGARVALPLATRTHPL